MVEEANSPEDAHTSTPTVQRSGSTELPLPPGYTPARSLIPPPPRTGTMSKTTKVTLNGIEVDVNTSGNARIKTTRVDKQQRASLGTKDKKDFEDEATKHQQSKYGLISASASTDDTLSSGFLEQPATLAQLIAATRENFRKYDIISASASTDDALSSGFLEQSATLAQLIAATRENFRKYDIDDVFNLVTPHDVHKSSGVQLTKDKAGNDVVATINLFTEYACVSVQDVANSCHWHNKYPDATQAAYVQENLRLTLLYFSNNCTKSLYEAVLDKYRTFDAMEQGGPLFFKIMMDHLVHQTEQLASHIINSIVKYKIQDVQGENITVVVRCLRANVTNLYNVKRLPTDIDLTLLKVFQETSVPNFNNLINKLYIDRYAALLTPKSHLGASTLPIGHLRTQNPAGSAAEQKDLYERCCGVFLYAENAYVAFRHEWNVPSARNDAAAVASGGSSASSVSSVEGTDASGVPTFRIYKASALLGRLCWNCGSPDHVAGDCSKPPNEKKIKANRDAFLKARKSKTSGSSSGSSGKRVPTKWAPPGAGEGNQRFINDRMHTWDPDAKRWYMASTDSHGGSEGESGAMGSTSSSSYKAHLARIANDLTELQGQLRDQL